MRRPKILLHAAAWCCSDPPAELSRDKPRRLPRTARANHRCTTKPERMSPGAESPCRMLVPPEDFVACSSRCAWCVLAAACCTLHAAQHAKRSMRTACTRDEHAQAGTSMRHHAHSMPTKFWLPHAGDEHASACGAQNLILACYRPGWHPVACSLTPIFGMLCACV
jgi:hypothetical protein